MRIRIKRTTLFKLIVTILVLKFMLSVIFFQSKRSIQDFSLPDNIFPVYSDKTDRIVNQLNFKEIGLTNVKTIVLYGRIGSREDIPLALKSCPIKQCIFTDNEDLQPQADAIVFNGKVGRIANLFKPQKQVWVFFELESPLHSAGMNIMTDNIKAKINFTATYRRDSVVVTPYEKFVPYDNRMNHFQNLKTTTLRKNYAKGKTKMVAWFVSNCNAKNGRMEYVKELQKYVSVDIYGGCGPFKCPRYNAASCFQKLNKVYKFYLAFENSNCVDYITEKLYWNGLNNDVVPIVMGARKEDYDAVVPPHSVIHVDDFESPKHLAKYLKLLNDNDQLYNTYFKWKGTGEFINTKFWCRLCAMLHASDQYKIWYQDFSQWWNPSGMCVHPSNEQMWSSWRNNSQQVKIKPWQYDKHS